MTLARLHRVLPDDGPWGTETCRNHIKRYFKIQIVTFYVLINIEFVGKNSFVLNFMLCWLCSSITSWPTDSQLKSTTRTNLFHIHSKPPDDRLQICPKHVEVDWRNKMRINSASNWFSLHGLNTKFRPHIIFFNSYGLLNKAFFP